MTKSDIILDKDKVVLKGTTIEVDGELKIGTLSSKYRTTEVLLNGGLEIIPNNIVEDKVRLTATALHFGGKNSRISAKRITGVESVYTETVTAREIIGTDIRLGNAGDSETIARNGRVALLNSLGKETIVLEVSPTPKISVTGYGELIAKIKDLEAKVLVLERKVKSLVIPS